MRPNVGRLSTFESPWEAWCDPIRVLIRVLQLGLAHPLQRLDLAFGLTLATSLSASIQAIDPSHVPRLIGGERSSTAVACFFELLVSTSPTALLRTDLSFGW